MLLKLKESKVVFAAFIQHCIQSYSICYSCQKGRKCTLYTVASCPCQEGRLLCEPSVLGVKLFTTSQSEEAALLTFLYLPTTRVIAGKMHSQSPILKNKRALSNPVILTYLWEQSCILQTLTKTACLCKF